MSSVNLDGNPIELSGKFPETGDNAPPLPSPTAGWKKSNWTAGTANAKS